MKVSGKELLSKSQVEGLYHTALPATCMGAVMALWKKIREAHAYDEGWMGMKRWRFRIVVSCAGMSLLTK
jgi:hypothetical protein